MNVLALASRPGDGYPSDLVSIHVAKDYQPDEITKLIDGSDIETIIHLASARVANSIDELTEVNVRSVCRILTAIQKSSRKPRLILVSSSAVFGVTPRDLKVDETFRFQPISQYGATKAAADILAQQFCEENGIPLVIARPFNLIGVGQAPDFFCAKVIKQGIQMFRGEIAKIRLGGLDSVRDFLDVRDFCDGLIKILLDQTVAGTFHLCSGEATQLSTVVDFVSRKINREIPVEMNSSEIVLKSNVPFQVGSYQKIKSELDWEPRITLEDSLEAMWDDQLRRTSAGTIFNEGHAH